MACKVCDTLMRKGAADLGEDGEDGIGRWVFEKLTDGTIMLSYEENGDVIGSLEVNNCPFCGQKLS